MAAARKLNPDDLINRLDELPTLPTIVHELSQVINDPMSSTAEVEKLMANDQSMTTKVLKLVNSAYYAIPGGVSTLARAIAYLGFDTVHQLVLSASILDALSTDKKTSFDLNEFWKHSLGVAVAAETIAKFVHHPLPADLFTCGLVHDMGKVATFTLASDEFLVVVDHANEHKISFAEAEQVLEYPRHTVIGNKLATKWSLPSQIQAVAKHHHQADPGLRGGLSGDLNRSVDIVFLANLLTHALKFGNSGHQKILGAPVEVMERLAINPQGDLKKLLLEIKGGLDRAADFLRVLGGNS
ncbi:MAG: HDOD domain-containing protein [Bdellovibrionales bacterium]